jgi:hypothetical protein
LCQTAESQKLSFTTATTTIIMGLTAGKLGKTAGCNGSSQHDRANPGISESRPSTRQTKDRCRKTGT